jgi:hypothetical protein
MQNKNKCKGIFGFLLGHRFSPRYSLTPEHQEASLKALSAFRIALSEFRSSSTNIVDSNECLTAKALASMEKIMLKDKITGTYVKDICTRCGHEIVNFVSNNTERRLDPDL